MNVLLFKGFIIGFLTSISFGPVAILIIKKTQNKEYRRGIIAGLGASTMETIYAIIAGSAIGIAYNFFEQHQIVISIIGTSIIIFLGIKIILAKNDFNNVKKNCFNTSASDFFSTFSLEFFNPQNIFIFTFLFSTFKILPKETSFLDLVRFYFGVFVGTNIWWNFMVIFAVSINRKFKIYKQQWFNKFIGSLVIILGLIFLYLSIN